MARTREIARPWTQQPQEAATLSDEFADVFAYNAAARRGARGEPVSAAVVAPGLCGLEASASGIYGVAGTVRLRHVSALRGITLIWYGSVSSAVGDVPSLLGATAHQLSELAGLAGIGNYLKFQIHGPTWGSRTDLFAGTVPGLNLSTPTCIVATWHADTNNYGTIYVNGTAIAGTAQQTSLISSITNGGVDGGEFDEQYGVAQNVAIPHTALLAVAYRDVGDRGRDISANPWSLYRPQRLYVPRGVAALAPTLLTASAINIASTSFRPRVTFTR